MGPISISLIGILEQTVVIMVSHRGKTRLRRVMEWQKGFNLLSPYAKCNTMLSSRKQFNATPPPSDLHFNMMVWIV